jgi:predicted carbohydrate-binding protein with CBM5 and CBM33 domain
MAVRDVVNIPSDLKPGKYILGWRWDCEATAQVWSNCADVTLVASDEILV